MQKIIFIYYVMNVMDYVVISLSVDIYFIQLNL